MSWLRYGSTGGFAQYDHVCIVCGCDFKSKKAVAGCCTDHCYVRSPGAKAISSKSSKKYKEENYAITKERNLLANYSRYYFPRRKTCSMPGCSGLGERHHPDYNRPYEISWLCTKHHRECDLYGAHPQIPKMKIEKNILWETRYFKKNSRKYCLILQTLQKRQIYKH
jgi:hypothetical protein